MTRNSKDFFKCFFKTNLIVILLFIVLVLTPFREIFGDFIFLVLTLSILFITLVNFFNQEDKIKIGLIWLSIIWIPLSFYLTIAFAPTLDIYMREETATEFILFLILSYIVSIIIFIVFIQKNNQWFIKKEKEIGCIIMPRGTEKSLSKNLQQNENNIELSKTSLPILEKIKRYTQQYKKIPLYDKSEKSRMKNIIKKELLNINNSYTRPTFQP